MFYRIFNFIMQWYNLIASTCRDWEGQNKGSITFTKQGIG